MLGNLIDLVASYASLPFCQYYLYPILLMAFLATVPCIIRSFWRH